MSMLLNIVTPERRTFSDSVDQVVLPGSEGEMGVLPGHAALVTTLKPGELRYLKDGQETSLAVGEGVVEVTQTGVSVLTDMAILEADINEALVQEALERAERALLEKIGSEEVAAVQASIQKSLAQLHLKRRRRNL
ncbi:MAG TPA: ATP synthase F1 subunit epsilon [Verrucomicrobiales bacterium]|nr:ATP synthase F1 subunit epsilon [Verrucomicrobiae bacterium]MCP5554384.1 ATP synthase F1 subunit epsilon [Akkermansiaceae bacterium]HRX56359.1 ATP synthase F1 subunit epsilon [Verrucomicrobiales bacterium]